MVVCQRFFPAQLGRVVSLSVVGAIGCLVLALGAANAHDYRPSFRPETLKGPPVGAQNEVLVLGTAHLSGLPKTFSPEMLSPLLDRLARWHPTAIATESVSGLQCDSLRRFPSRYSETIPVYCPDTAPAVRSIGLDVPAANADMERLLGAWPTVPTAAQRRHLAAVFLAAGELGSALVQWLRLAPAEQRSGDGLNGELVGLLTKLKDRRTETSLISAALAARLGLERLWSVDDHSADAAGNGDAAEQKAATDAIARAWDNPAAHAREAEDARLSQGLSRPGGILALYRSYNASAAPAVTYRADFGAALVEPSNQQFGQYVGYWETRNLRMVANIRDVLGRYPGMRLLAIVGASHKGYYEAYLDEMHDVRLVDPDVVLR